MKKRNIMAVTLIFAMIISMTACSKEEAASKVMATVNEVEITESDVNQYKPFYFSMLSLDPAEAVTEIQIKQMLNDLVTMEVLTQNYQDKKSEIVPADIDEQLASIEKDENNQAFFKEYGITPAFLKKFYTSQSYMGYFFEGLEAKIAEKEPEARAIYDADLAKYADQVRASHILVNTEEEAKAARQRVVNGEDFAELAKELSIEPAAQTTGGDLGYFNSGTMVEPFSKAAFAMEIGEISQPVQTQFGYHIIKLVDKKTIPFEEVFSQEGDLYREMFDIVYEEQLDAIKKTMNIEYKD